MRVDAPGVARYFPANFYNCLIQTSIFEFLKFKRALREYKVRTTLRLAISASVARHCVK